MKGLDKKELLRKKQEQDILEKELYDDIDVCAEYFWLFYQNKIGIWSLWCWPGMKYISKAQN